MESILASHEADLFEAAAKLSEPEARRSFLEKNCEGDDALRRRIERLLAVRSQADRLFGEIGSTLTFSSALLPLVKNATAEAWTLGRPALADETPIGSRIGRYKLVKKIGEGGGGVVFLAEQEEPVRRPVALKIIKVGLETRSFVARFEAERQALAMMDHPNIARVFDAGATEQGRPYFVMELVRGVRLTDYCDQNQLDLRTRLTLFVQVCQAIQHAHQKGIIHGDIKPSNILVTLHDGRGVPKVIDFGISNATEAGLADQAANDSPTEWIGLIGTPAYMSPEQAQANRVDVDTRSDIYSLGALLYELVTGRTPFDSKALLSAGIDEMRRTLRETRPVLPSISVGQLPLEELGLIAERRRTSPRNLIRTLEEDLDWVIVRALEKDRSRRYETANGLALDIQRHLENEPVAARPPARLYRFKKLVQRHRGIFLASCAITLALVAGLGASSWLFLRERAAHRRAVAAERHEATLRHQAEAREKITEAALLVRQEKFAEADDLLKAVPLPASSVEGAAVLRAVGTWHALQGQWRQAADRFSVLLDINRLDPSETTTLDPLRYAPVLLELGDTRAYAQFRDALIARFSGSNVRITVDRVVRASLLLPASPRVLESLQPLAKTMVEVNRNTPGKGDDLNGGWEALAIALWEYRQGNLTAAVAWSDRALSYRDPANAPRTAMARIVLALAYVELDQPEQARNEFEQARDLVEVRYESQLDRGTPLRGFWFDWSFARILLHEAAVAIEPSPSAR